MSHTIHITATGEKDDDPFSWPMDEHTWDCTCGAGGVILRTESITSPTRMAPVFSAALGHI